MNTGRRRFRSKNKWTELTSVYGEMCCYCHVQIATQLDHVIPYTFSFDNSIHNLRPSCAWCNLLASDKVFESFEDKYDYIKRKRDKATNKRNKMLTCTCCMLPYYSELSNCNAFLCPRCYAYEYDTVNTGIDFAKWLDLLIESGIDYQLNFALADKIHSGNMFGIRERDRIAMMHD